MKSNSRNSNDNWKPTTSNYSNQKLCCMNLNIYCGSNLAVLRPLSIQRLTLLIEEEGCYKYRKKQEDCTQKSANHTTEPKLIALLPLTQLLPFPGDAISQVCMCMYLIQVNHPLQLPTHMHVYRGLHWMELHQESPHLINYVLRLKIGCNQLSLHLFQLYLHTFYTLPFGF